MAIPVVDTKISLPVFRAGEYFSFLPAASHTPTSWHISLSTPDLTALGLTFDGDTGLLTGAFKAEGFYDLAITAENGDGISDPLFLPLGIWPALSGADPTIEIDVDLETGLVTRTISPGNAGDPVLYGKHGDHLVLDVGFTKAGVLLDAPLSFLRFGTIEFEEDPLLADLNDGTFFVIGGFSARRFRIVVDLDDDRIKGALSNYLSRKANEEFFDAIAELEWIMLIQVAEGGDPVGQRASSRDFILRLAADIVPN